MCKWPIRVLWNFLGGRVWLQMSCHIFEFCKSEIETNAWCWMSCETVNSPLNSSSLLNSLLSVPTIYSVLCGDNRPSVKPVHSKNMNVALKIFCPLIVLCIGIMQSQPSMTCSIVKYSDKHSNQICAVNISCSISCKAEYLLFSCSSWSSIRRA